MAIEDIFRALEAQADADCDAILKSARTQARSITNDAKQQADEIRRRKVAEAETIARTEYTHSLNSARLVAKKGVAAVKGRAVSDVFSSALECLADVRGEAGYPELFRKLAEEALCSVNSDFVMLVDPRDETLVRDFLSARGGGGAVETSLETGGGLVVTTKEGRISRNNTLEDRLGRVRKTAQSQIAEILFG